MLKKILKVLRNNLLTIMCIVIFILLCIFISDNYMDIVNEIDLKVQTFFSTKMINESSTTLMKNITLLGSEVAIIIIFILSLVAFRNKITTVIITLDLFFTGALSLGLKYFFKRPRPVSSLIETPITNSFPSGHTLFAVGFYGLLVFFIWRTSINKFYKYLLTFIISMIIIFIGISRLYLGVHYFSDVIGGFILGVLTLVLFIGIYLKYDWKWTK